MEAAPAPRRASGARPLPVLAAAPGIALAIVATLVAMEQPGAERQLIAVLVAIGVAIAWGAAMAMRSRYPERPLWILLCVVAIVHAMHPLVSSPNSLLFTLGRATRPGFEILLVWVMLAFPTGRLATWRERAILISLALAMLLLWLPGVMFTPGIPLRGAQVVCQPSCPEYLLFVRDLSPWGERFLAAFRVVGVLLLAATSLLLFQRLRRASPLMRRALLPVLLASIARVVYIAVFLAAGTAPNVPIEASRITAQLAGNLTVWAVPLAIVWGMLRGRLYTARALQRLVTGLRRRHGPGELRGVMSEALDDPALQVGYWSAAKGCWVDAAQHVLPLPAPDDADVVARVLNDADGRPAAVLVHDRALLEEPLLLDAVASSMQGALLGHQAELALAGRQVDSVTAVEHERRRIERDLHDGAQQRLLALRMKLGVSKRLLDDDPRRAGALLGEMDSDIDAAIVELRALAHGIVPPLLAERGLSAALADVALHAAIPVALDLQDVGRVDPTVERAVYFCCVEALQNAAKHAGEGARARMALKRTNDTLSFSVEDTGRGPPTGHTVVAGQGMRNMRERLVAVGGTMEIGAAVPAGMRVSGTAPATSA